MRTLLNTSTFPLQNGDGIPRFVKDLAVKLSGAGPVTVVAPGAPWAQSHEQFETLDLYRYTYFLPRRLQRLAYGNGMPSNLRSSLLARIQAPLLVASQIWLLRQLIRAKKIDVVNSHWMIPQGLCTALVRGANRKVGHVLSVHAADVSLLAQMSAGRKMARFIVNRSDQVLADGSHVRDQLDRLLGFDSSAKIQPMGVNNALFRDPTGRVSTQFEHGYILFFGRFAEKKGVRYLIQAMPKIRQHFPKIGLVIIGYGELEADLKERASNLGLDEIVSFEGRKCHEEIGAYLKACRLAVVPSIIDQYGDTEGMPTVVLEAMASGTPVVASAVDGIPDVIRHGVNGWLCREKDSGDLAEKVILALSDPRAESTIQCALETAHHHSWDSVGEVYLDALRQACRSIAKNS